MRSSSAMRCKNYKCFFNVLIALIFTTSSFSQEETDKQELPVKIMQGNGFYTWVDNSPRTFVTIDFPGEEIEAVDGVDFGFNLDGFFYQLLPRDYSSDQYTNRDDSEKEDALLKYFQKYEQDYLEDEVFNEKLEATDEFYFNSEGKKFHIWSYKSPQSIIDQMGEDGNPAAYHYYLDFVANDKVYGIYTVSFADEPVETAMKRVKDISESVDVFGYYIDLDALGYRLIEDAKNDTIQYIEPKANYSLDIPQWLNITRSDYEGVFFATFPDNDNVKNAMSISFYPEEEFKSFKAFNKEKLIDLKMMDKIGSTTVLLKNELEAPENSTGVSYKIQQMAGNVMYEMQYVTYETPTGYLLINFTATPETYDKNAPRFREVLTGLSFDIEEDEEEKED